MFIVSVHFRTLPYAATCNISVLGYTNERFIHLIKHVRVIKASLLLLLLLTP